ncbi:MAG: GNAT family N-acetyltransferase, partial [Actinomycetota bacterium]
NDREYRRRLGAQERGLLAQAIAWDGETPVGAAMVLFPGHDQWSISARRRRCAEVRAVEVTEHARRRGIATQLMAFLEREAAARGFERIGLTVSEGPEAIAARALYEGLGYRFAHGPFVSSATLDATEGPRPVYVVARYLVKSLDDAAARR